MSSTNDLNTMEILDDIENLVFLCDRLSSRLTQVTSYVDEVKQTWITKRRSIELDTNPSPIVAQKVIKCNKVLLNVAEKLAVVELQTELLHNLHSSVRPPITMNHEKPCPPPAPVISQPSVTRTEPMANGIRSQRDIIPTTTRLVNNNNPTNAFTARNTSTLFSGTVSVKTPTEQPQQQSAFHRPLSVQSNPTFQQPKISPLASQTPQNQLSSKILSNGSLDSYSSMFMISNFLVEVFLLAAKANEPGIIEEKVRVKMQMISSGTIWRNADIPIVDHPSAFFVSNQDPRVAEQFSIMATEMK